LVRKILTFSESTNPNIPELCQLTVGVMAPDSEFKPCSEWLGLGSGVAQIIPLRDRKLIALHMMSNERANDVSGLQGVSIKYSKSGNRYLNQFWVNNVVAMGRSAFELPITPWGEFKWFRNQVVRFIELFIDFDVLTCSASEYNRLSLIEYEMISEMTAMNFFLGRANKDFVDFFNENPPLPELQHRLKLFSEVGRHSSTSDQVISESRLGAFFLGNNIIPNWSDIDLVKNPEGLILNYCQNLYSLSQAAANKLPSYSDFMQQYILHNQKQGLSERVSGR